MESFFFFFRILASAFGGRNLATIGQDESSTWQHLPFWLIILSNEQAFQVFLRLYHLHFRENGWVGYYTLGSGMAREFSLHGWGGYTRMAGLT